MRGSRKLIMGNLENSLIAQRRKFGVKKATIETEKGTMVVELYEQDAPGTVENFVKLIEEKFYDGVTFHRVIPGFVIQGGCPKGTGTGGPGYSIKCETDNNPNKHIRGSLSMAHAGKDTGGSQFFICYAPQPHLDGKHTVFGKVIEGDEVIDKISKGDKIIKMTVEV